MKYKEKW